MGYGVGHYGYGGFGIMTKTASVTVQLEEQGELTVQVNDDTGAGMEAVNVTIENADGSFTDSGSTDTNGQVIFGGIPIDDFTVTASKTGFFDAQAGVAAGDFT